MNRIRELRKERGWTIEQLAERANVSKGHISKLERGGTELKQRQIEQFAQIFGVHPGAILVPIDPAAAFAALTEAEKRSLRTLLAAITAA